MTKHARTLTVKRIKRASRRRKMSSQVVCGRRRCTNCGECR